MMSYFYPNAGRRGGGDGGGGGGGGLTLAQARGGLKLAPQAVRGLIARGATHHQTVTAAQTLQLNNTPVRISPAVAEDRVMFLDYAYLYKPAGVAGVLGDVAGRRRGLEVYVSVDGAYNAAARIVSSTDFFDADVQRLEVRPFPQGRPGTRVQAGLSLWVRLDSTMTEQDQDIQVLMNYDLWTLL